MQVNRSINVPVKLQEQHAKYARFTGSLVLQGGDEIMIAPFFTGKQEDNPIIVVRAG